MAKIALNDGFVPKYMQIRDYLMNKIRMGELGQGEMIPSEWELARQFNVSRITAVKAVKELEAQGLVIREQGRGTFVSNNVTVGIPISATHNIGLVVSDLSYVGLPYLNRVIRAINQNLNMHGYNLVLYGLTGNNESKAFSVENVIIKKQVDGVIVEDEAPPEIIKFLCEQDVPFVQIGRCLENKAGLRYSRINIDYYAGVLKGLKNLVERGREKIVFLCEMVRPELVEMWTCFYAEASRELGVPFHRDYVYVGPYGEESGHELVRRLFDKNVMPDGILATDDMIAFGALKELKLMGVGVPEEVAIIGFGNYFLDSELTTVETNLYKMGSKAADYIIKQLSPINTQGRELLEEILEPKLIIRRT